MELEQIKNQKKAPAIIEDIDFDFKPITSGLGFHQKQTEIKPAFTERSINIPSAPVSQIPVQSKKEMNVYQNDISIFYNQNSQPVQIVVEKTEEQIYYKLASKPQRIFAYVSDLLLVASILGIVLTVMARTISMDLIEVWSQYPNEITPLVVSLFCGFYLMYFSIFDKSSATLGKNIFGLKVVGMDDRPLSLMSLVIRSFVSLLNFVSLGLFSFFDLQNKMTNSKVIQVP
jgi:uncharacterized RDD family membrane protein YckC